MWYYHIQFQHGANKSNLYLLIVPASLVQRSHFSIRAAVEHVQSHAVFSFI